MKDEIIKSPIYHVRVKHGLTQIQFCKRLGTLSQGALSKLERGQLHSPDVFVLHKLRTKFKVKLPKFIKETVDFYTTSKQEGVRNERTIN